MGLNVVLMAGHNTIRADVMGPDYKRYATPSEIASMQKRVREAMEDGAFGLTTGLEYVPGRWSHPDEVVALMEVVAPYDGVHISHMRSQASSPRWWLPSRDPADPLELLDGVREIIEIAEQTGTRGVVSHMKVRSMTHWGQSAEVIKLIEAARRRGVEVYGDQYPYDSSGSDGSLVLIPDWALGLDEDGDDYQGLAARLADTIRDPESRDLLYADIEHRMTFRGGPAKIVIFDHPDETLIGKSLLDFAEGQGMSPIEATIELQMNGFEDRPGGARIRAFSFHEKDIDAMMSQPWVATSSDGGVALAEDGPTVHARYTGSFPRKIAYYVRERGTVSLEFAIRAGTSLPAQILGIRDRGLIRPGLVADIVVFDEDRIQDNATFVEPHRLSTGIDYVWVNGEATLFEGEATGALPGIVLHRDTSGAD